MPFEPGVSGSPGGRRKERPYRDAMRKVLAELIEDAEPKEPRTKLEAVVRAHVTKAMTGDAPSILHIADRLDGKVPQALIGSDDPDDAPLTLALVELRAVGVFPTPEQVQAGIRENAQEVAELVTRTNALLKPEGGQ